MEKKLIKIVHALRLARGNNAKLAILKEHSDNELWKKFLIYTYDGSLTYGVSAPKDPAFDEVEIPESMFYQLQDLITRKVTGNEAKMLAKMLSDTYGEIPRLILGRSIKAGVSYTTINKAYPGLIFVFESMKGKDCPITEWPVASSIKYDGVKIFTFVTPTETFFTTSTGASFVFQSLHREMSIASPGVYEGELIHGEGKVVDRPKITGKLNKLLSGAKDIKDYSYMIYDMIPLEDWAKKDSIMSFKDRNLLLSHNIAQLPNLVHTKVVQHHTLETLEKVITFYNYYQSQGYEGSMHRYMYDPYRWDRSERLVKKKAINEAVLLCTGTVPHTNPAKGITGSLICTGTVDGKTVNVKVGSGLSKYEVMQDESYFAGNQVEILYNSVTETDQGYSLFLPRFKRIVGGL